MMRVSFTDIIYDEVYLRAVNYFCKKSSIVDIRLGSKYTFEMIYLVRSTDNNKLLAL